MSKQKRVAVYARVSTDGQTTENQLRELRSAVERNGWTIAAEYVDHGVSGAKGRKDRPQFDALLRPLPARTLTSWQHGQRDMRAPVESRWLICYRASVR